VRKRPAKQERRRWLTRAELDRPRLASVLMRFRKGLCPWGMRAKPQAVCRLRSQVLARDMGSSILLRDRLALWRRYRIRRL
jgi:hypothetical protein